MVNRCIAINIPKVIVRPVQLVALQLLPIYSYPRCLHLYQEVFEIDLDLLRLVMNFHPNLIQSSQYV